MKKLISIATFLASIGFLAACAEELDVPETEERPPAITSQTSAATGSAVATPEGGGQGTATSVAKGTGYTGDTE